MYALTRPMGQRLASNISDAVAQLDAITEDAPPRSTRYASSRIALTRCRSICSNPAISGVRVKSTTTTPHFVHRSQAPAGVPRHAGRVTHAGLCRVLHRMAYGSAGFYGGDLSVIRQFGLAIYFSGSMRPALRSCAPPVAPGSYPAAAKLPRSKSGSLCARAWRLVSASWAGAMRRYLSRSLHTGDAG